MEFAEKIIGEDEQMSDAQFFHALHRRSDEEAAHALRQRKPDMTDRQAQFIVNDMRSGESEREDRGWRNFRNFESRDPWERDQNDAVDWLRKARGQE
jgi:hypothetical protein